MPQNQPQTAPPNMYKVMYEFSRYTTERLREAIRKGEIGVSNKLRGSIMFTINKDGDSVRSVIFKYLNYGKYVDMGVGRGMPLGSKRKLGADFYKKRNDKGELHRMLRKPNPWYSKTIYGQNKALADILEKHFGLSATNIVNENLPTIINITL